MPLARLYGQLETSAFEVYDYPTISSGVKKQAISIAASKGNVATAEAALELTSDVSIDFLEWFFSR